MAKVMAQARADSLVIHAASPRWDWVLSGRDGQLRSQGSDVPQTPSWPQETPAIVLMDAARCVGLSLELPPLRGARLQQALRWAAEEHLAGSAEDEHVVAGPRGADGRLHCLSVAAEVMDELGEALEATAARLMLPDALCLPWQEGQVSLAQHDSRLLLRWGPWDFAALEIDQAEGLLETFLPADAQWCWLAGTMPAWLDSQRVHTVPQDRPLALLLAEQAPKLGVNLLAGPWAPKVAAQAQQRWRQVGVLALLVLALLLTSAGLEHRKLKQQSRALDEAIAAQYQQVFPEAGRRIPGREQALAERELARLRFGQAAGMLDLMHQVAPVLNGQEALVLDGLDYRDGTLELALRAPDVAALEQLEQRLRALGLGAAVQTASVDADGTSGRIRVRRGGGA